MLNNIIDMTDAAQLIDDSIDTYEWLDAEPTVCSPVITDALRSLTAKGAAALSAVELF